MPQYARVIANLVIDGELEADQIVVLVPIDKKLAQVDGQYFGYFILDENKLPFIGQSADGLLRLDFGDGADDIDQSSLNITSKALSVGQLFTNSLKIHDDQEEYSATYQIKSIVI